MLRIFPLNSKLEEFKNVNDQGTIIIGEPLTSKTSLLFQAAVSLASEGKSVWFIRSSKFVNMPLCIRDMVKPTITIMKFIKFLYFDNSKDLFKYLAELHLSPYISDAILVDDIQHYVQSKDENLEHTFARLLALFKDSVDFMSSRTNEKCIFISTITENKLQSVYAHICQIFFDLWQINAQNEYFCITSYSNPRIRIEYGVQDEVYLKELKIN